MGLVFEWIKRKGGLSEMESNSKKKSRSIYNIIDNTNSFYYCPVQKNVRSRMNIPFRIGGEEGIDSLEEEFLQQAEVRGMIQLKGHRSVGGIRASLYNAVTIEETHHLVKLMVEFYEKNKK